VYKVLKRICTKYRCCIRLAVRTVRLEEETPDFSPLLLPSPERPLLADDDGILTFVNDRSPPALRRPLLADDDSTSSSDVSIKQEYGHTPVRVSPVNYGSLEY